MLFVILISTVLVYMEEVYPLKKSLVQNLQGLICAAEGTRTHARKHQILSLDVATTTPQPHWNRVQRYAFL